MAAPHNSKKGKEIVLLMVNFENDCDGVLGEKWRKREREIN